MDKLQQVKAKLEEMKAKYNFERENEDNPNHSDGWGMFYSGFFTCLKEISIFLDTFEVKEADLEKEIEEHAQNMPHGEFTHDSECAEHEEWAKREFRHFYSLGLAQKGE